MRYLSFEIRNYRAIEGPLVIDLEKSNLVPLVGINECGKTTILQAIYCFDNSNDEEYDGKHLKDIKNLYQPKSKGIPLVISKIELKYSDIVEFYQNICEEYNEKITEEIEELDEEDDQEEIKLLEAKIVPTELPIKKSNFKNSITIERNLETLNYKILNQEFAEILNEDFSNELSLEVIAHLPYVLYNDDFMDRPPTFIDIPKTEAQNHVGWLGIYNQLFISTSEDYSLFKLTKEKDSRIVDSILSDVETSLNKTLSKAWKTFLLSNHGAITIKLKYISTPEDPKNAGRLEIKVVEKIDQRDRHFDVIDRSKGFLWFFNFVMKLEFNPKIIAEAAKNTIYLLDEPGSYLHYSAQEKLCSKLKNIAQKHGVVIFCTHSHTLLNPNEIPLNTIYIVEKDRSKKIKAAPLPQAKSKADANNAYQPILEALQISAFHYGKGNEKIIAVEGIYDKYSIELMVNPEDTLVLPGTSANSIVKNIQFLNGFNKKYIAIWDNDEEGRKEFIQAKNFFGNIESQKFDLLPLCNRAKMRMESMFNENDFEILKKELDYDSTASYEKLISALYFQTEEKKKKIIQKFATSTKQNFDILKAVIKKRFDFADKIAIGEIQDLEDKE